MTPVENKKILFITIHTFPKISERALYKAVVRNIAINQKE